MMPGVDYDRSRRCDTDRPIEKKNRKVLFYGGDFHGESVSVILDINPK